jgi:hypothetical protein
MKRITCIVSDEKMKLIDTICKDNHYTHAEFNRRAIDCWIDEWVLARGKNGSFSPIKKEKAA